MSDLELYERRTYDVHVGEMSKVLELYSSQGWPALEAGGHSRFLVGYFVSDTGPLHQLIHMWRFSGDVERREIDVGEWIQESRIKPVTERITRVIIGQDAKQQCCVGNASPHGAQH